MIKLLKSSFKIKPENIYLLLSFLFGLSFLFITPIFQVPDEPMHLLRACEVSNLILHNDKSGNITKDIFPNKKLLLKRNCSQFQEFKKYEHYTKLFEFEDLSYRHNNSGYPFFLYIPSSIGIKLTSLITSNPYIIFYSARFFNLIFWITLTFYAIKITPIYKWSFLICALFPMTIYEGMSISADSINISFAFFYVAYIYYLAYNKKNTVNNKEFCFYLFLSFLTILTKGLFLLTFLSFLIPREKLNLRYNLNIFIIILIILLQVKLSANSFILTANNVDIETRKSLIITTPLSFIKLLINTIINKASFYIQSSIFRLGWLNIEPQNIAIIILFTTYLISATFESYKIKFQDRILLGTICIIFITLTILLYFLTFSPLDADIIIGVQGRYFIPLYPIFIPILQNNLIKNFSAISINIIKLIVLTIITINLFYALHLIITN